LTFLALQMLSFLCAENPQLIVFFVKCIIITDFRYPNVLQNTLYLLPCKCILILIIHLLPPSPLLFLSSRNLYSTLCMWSTLRTCYLSFYAWLISLNSSIHIASAFHLFLWLNNIPSCTYIMFSLYTHSLLDISVDFISWILLWIVL
jgi:hypothetical protein